MKEEHTLSILVQNEPGVLTKIAQMFYRRGYNIETLTVGKTHRPKISKILISVPLGERDVEYLRRQIENLVDVHSAKILDRQKSFLTEVCLIRLGFNTAEERARIMSSSNPYRARLIDIDKNSITLEVAEKPDLIEDFVATLDQYEIRDVSRTGMTAMGPVLNDKTTTPPPGGD